MWVAAGFPPETFWKQTHRSFTNALTGAARSRLTVAWQQAALAGAAFAGKLKELSEYLPSEEAVPGSAAMLGFMFKMKRKGIPMTIERLH